MNLDERLKTIILNHYEKHGFEPTKTGLMNFLGIKAANYQQWISRDEIPKKHIIKMKDLFGINPAFLTQKSEEMYLAQDNIPRVDKSNDDKITLLEKLVLEKEKVNKLLQSEVDRLRKEIKKYGNESINLYDMVNTFETTLERIVKEPKLKYEAKELEKVINTLKKKLDENDL